MPPAAKPPAPPVQLVFGEDEFAVKQRARQIYQQGLAMGNLPTHFSKIGDCLKEIEETEYWLELLVDSGCVSAAKMADLLDEARQLIAIFTTIDKN